MPFSLGFWATAGAGGGSVSNPALEQISTVIVSSNTETVTFSSIPQTYRHLHIRWTGRNSVSWGADGGANVYWARLNGATGSLYSRHAIRADSGGISALGQGSLTYFGFPQSLANAFSPTNAFSGGLIDILDYTNSSTNKTIRTFAGYTSVSPENPMMHFGSGVLAQTGAVTSITLGAGNNPGSGGNWIPNSRFTLYGIKG